jgi:hypothetical protein
MGAEIIENQPLGFQGGYQRLFERQAGMVRGDGDGHGRGLRWPRDVILTENLPICQSRFLASCHCITGQAFAGGTVHALNIGFN